MEVAQDVRLISRTVDSVTNFESSFLRLIAVDKPKYFMQLQYLATSYNLIKRVCKSVTIYI